MKKILLFAIAALLVSTSSAHAAGVCWGAELQLSDDNINPKLMFEYTAKDAIAIFTNINVPETDHKEFMCSVLWVYFSFMKKGNYDKKEMAGVTQAFISRVGTQMFLDKLNGMTKILKVLPVLEGFNGKSKPNDNESAYVKFSTQENNKFFVDLMDNNENIFLAIKDFLKDDQKGSLKNIVAADLFNLVVYFSDKGYLDPDYFGKFNEYRLELETELSKINKG